MACPRPFPEKGAQTKKGHGVPCPYSNVDPRLRAGSDGQEIPYVAVTPQIFPGPYSTLFFQFIHSRQSGYTYRPMF